MDQPWWNAACSALDDIMAGQPHTARKRLSEQMGSPALWQLSDALNDLFGLVQTILEERGDERT